MRRSEVKWCLGYSVVLAALTTLPYLIAPWSQGEDWRFTGFLLGVEDGNSYIAKMLNGHEGAWLFKSPYTTIEQEGVLAFLPYLLLGKLAGHSHESSVIAFHLLRVLALPWLVLATYRFIGLFVDQPAWRKWATLLATAGGGLGWLAIMFGRPVWLGSLPLEFYSPETFGFLEVYALPHLELGRAALLTALTLYLAAPSGWGAGAMLLLAGLIHSPVLLSGLAVLIAHQIAVLGFASGGQERWIWIRRFGRVVLPSLPLVAYLGLAYSRDPFLQVWAEQNRILSPHPLHYLLAYGLLLPAAIVGGRQLLRQRGAQQLLPICWVILIPLLAYAPVNIQRRLPEAGWVALLTLSTFGLEQLARQRAGTLRIAMAAILLPSSLLILIGGVSTAMRPIEPAFRRTAEIKAFDWLKEDSAREAVVLAAYSTSNALPAWAPVRVVAGHGPETAGLEELSPKIHRFFSTGTTQEERLDLLVSQGVDYVFYGPAERALGPWDPATWGCLISVYRIEPRNIYISSCVNQDG